MTQYVHLALAVTLGLVGSSMLKICDGFTLIVPTVLLILSYFAAFYFFSLALKTLPLSMGYATWAGLSTALNAVIGLLLFGEALSARKILALLLVICGIVLINHAKKPSPAGCIPPASPNHTASKLP